jgi:demethoxyubiquinone hydroxylase (CLK1/Coq7/Cat5 family)
MWPALRSDHAGETGAVFIYRGIRAVSRDREVRAFATHHLATEEEHLRLMQELVPEDRRSRLIGLWQVAGFLTGALPALVGRQAVYRTIAAVETFVDQHYRDQTVLLRNDPDHGELHELLERCRLDEVAHRDDAASRLGPPGWIGRAWCRLVGFGSSLGVAAAARI